MRRMLFLVCSVFLTSVLVAQAPTQRPLRYVSEWEIPVDRWADYENYAERTVRPAFEALMSQQVILGWGIYRSVLIQDGARTHGLWFEAPSLEAVEDVLAVVSKLPHSPIPVTAKHYEYLFRAQLRRATTGSGRGGYLFVNTTEIQQGQREQWREWWDKNQKPNFDQYLAEGLITMYELVTEEIHHAGPNWVYLIYVTPSASALDKLNATFTANSGKRTPEERRAIQNAFDLTVVPAGHQDYIARASSYAQR